MRPLELCEVFVDDPKPSIWTYAVSSLQLKGVMAIMLIV